MLPFIYLTDGNVPAFDGSDVRQVVCQYGEAKIVALGNDALVSSIPFSRLGLKPGRIEMLRDEHNGFPYLVVTVTPLRARCPITALPAGTRLPPGVSTKDLAAVQGVFPSDSETCCLLGPSALFDVSMPAGAKHLALKVYVPEVPHALPQRLTIRIDGVTVETTGALAAGELTTVLATVPASSENAHLARVELLPSFSFVPKEVGMNQETNRYSVVLTQVVVQR